RLAEPHGRGRATFRVLTGLPNPSRWPELAAERVEAVLEACRRWVDHVVVDVGFNLEADEEIASDLLAPRRNATTLTVLEHADRVLAVTGADPVSLARFIRGHAELRRIVDAEAVSVIANRVRGTVAGGNP